jgi:predicted dehydrogenase
MKNPPKISPFVIGSGRSASAIKKSLCFLSIQNPQWQIEDPVQIERGQELKSVSHLENPILIITNPHGLHAEGILAGERAGFRAIAVEKPACVNLEQANSLKSVRVPVAVFHGYRQMWGLQTIKQMIDASEMGEVISVEGRYWQSSAAQRALNPDPSATSWKNDVRLSGESDALIDVGVHWVDAVSFLMGESTFTGSAWLSYANAEAPHRDNHVHLSLKYSNGRRALGSISKTVHGATNHFEVNVIGSKKSATWQFLNPDEILVGVGNSRQTVTRKALFGSQLPPFHGAGWLEGYIEILNQLLLETTGSGPGNYPTLSENVSMLESIFRLDVTKD